MSEGIIIHLFGEPPAVDGAPTKAKHDGFCWPHWPRLDEVSRTVTCAKCRKAIDAFDALLEVARQHEQWKRAREETTAMRNELDALKAEETRVRQRTQSHSRKDATAAVEAERAKSFRQRCEVVRHTNSIRGALKRIDQLMGTGAMKCMCSAVDGYLCLHCELAKAER